MNALSLSTPEGLIIIQLFVIFILVLITIVTKVLWILYINKVVKQIDQRNSQALASILEYVKRIEARTGQFVHTSRVQAFEDHLRTSPEHPSESVELSIPKLPEQL